MSTKNQPFFLIHICMLFLCLCSLCNHFVRRMSFYLLINLTRDFILDFYISPSILPASLPPLTSSHVRSTHQLFYPATDEPPLEHPNKQILPCDCSRSHIFLTQLDTINEEDPKTKDTSAFSFTSDALKRELDSFQFHYYLPHISDHGVDFYSD